MTTENISSATSSQSTFAIGFTVPTDTSEIQVYVEDASTGAMTLQTAGNHYNIVGTNVVFTSGNEPAAGTDNVQILRNTDVASTTLHRTFVAGSSIRAADLNANFTRLFDHAEDKIQTSDIANKAVTTAKIAKNAVTTNRIAGSAVTTAKINDKAVNTDKLGDFSVNTTKLQNLSVTVAKIVDGAVDADKIASNAVTTAKINGNAVTTAKINDNAVTTDKLGNFSVNTTKLQNLSVTVAKIADDAVDSDKIAPYAVTSAKIASNAVTTGKIANLTIVNNDINLSAAIAGTKISPNFGSQNITTTGSIETGASTFNGAITVSGTVDGRDVAADGTKLDTIATNADVTSTKNIGDLANVNTSGVSDGKILKYQASSSSFIIADDSGAGGGSTTFTGLSDTPANFSSSASKVLKVNSAGNAVEFTDIAAANIQDSAITSAKIASQSVTSNKINPLAVTTAKINDAAVTTAKIADDAVTGDKLANNLDLPDNNKIRFGTGNDLQIVHDGSFSSILNTTGNLNINSNSGNLNLIASNSAILSAAGAVFLRSNTTENAVIGRANGAVEQYYDAVKKVETSADGLNVTDGRLFVYNSSIPHIRINKTSGDTASTRFIFGIATGNDSFINGATQNTCCINTGGDNIMFGIASDKKLEINSSGIKVSKEINIEAVSANDFESGRVRFVESDANLNGGYIHYDGSGNKLKLGVHPFNDSTVGNDVNCIEIDRDLKNVELYYDGVKKFNTTSWGSYVNGTFQAINVTALGYIHVQTDNQSLKIGSGSDLTLYHDGNHSYIKNITGALYLKASSTRDGIQINNNGKVALFYQGVEKFRTSATGTTTLGISTADGAGTVGFKVPDNPSIGNATSSHGMLIAGTGDDLTMYHDGTDSYLVNNTGTLVIRSKAGEPGIKAIPDGAVELYYDGAKRLETYSNGAKIEKGGTAQFHLINTSTSGSNHVILGLRSYSDDGDTKISFGNSADDNPGEIKYFSDLNKFQIRANGSNTLQLTSTEILPNTDNALALGSASKRFTTLHSAALNTGDIHMSNLDHASGNEVNGTKGSWSLQEGADDLFLINRVNGKKYKFNLTEIS